MPALATARAPGRARPGPSLPPPRQHYPALDGLRGIAVLLVLYSHAPVLLGRGYAVEQGPWRGSAGAWLGVDLFFVLSGFLITSILLDGRGRDRALRRFLVRRSLRIFPLACLYLVVLAAVAWSLPQFATLRDGASFVFAATFLTNVHVATTGWHEPAFGHLWSLAVEEHFYVVWPLCALFAPRRVVSIVLVAAVVTAPVLRALQWPGGGELGVYVLTWCRWDTLGCGALLAVAWASPRRQLVITVARWLALPAAAALVAVVALPVQPMVPGAAPWFHVGGYSVVAASFTVWCTLALAPPRWLAHTLGNRALRYVGRVSYGMYVWHVLTAQLTLWALAEAGLVGTVTRNTAVWLVVLLAVVAASHRWFEAPLLRCKDRLAP